MSWWRRYQQAQCGAHPARRRRIALALTALVAVWGVAGCADTGDTQALSTPTARAPAATSTPTKPTIPQNAVLLGGSVFAFDKKFGASNCCYRNGWDYQGPYGTMWTGVDTTHTVAINVDESSTDRVIAVENGGNLDGLLNVTLAQGKAICGSFLPADAKLHTTTTVYLGNLADGLEDQYTSTLLANTLPPDDFADKNGKAMPPGTFSIFYNYSYSGSSSAPLVGQCTLATDESLLLLPS
jgi:hypothetical protein